VRAYPSETIPAIPQPGVHASGLFLSGVSAPGAGGVHAYPLVVPRKPNCVTKGCNSKRIRKGCGRRMCRAHCIEAGGCADPAHKGSDTSAMSYTESAPPTTAPRPFAVETTPALTTSTTTAASTSSQVIDPRLLCQSEIQIAIPPPAPSSTAPMRTLNEPAFTSHMTDLYTTQRALEENMREAGRQMEATRLESKRKVQQTVYVYAWMEVSL
jgi:hypothetical protein